MVNALSSLAVQAMLLADEKAHTLIADPRRLRKKQRCGSRQRLS